MMTGNPAFRGKTISSVKIPDQIYESEYLGPYLSYSIVIETMALHVEAMKEPQDSN